MLTRIGMAIGFIALAGTAHAASVYNFELSNTDAEVFQSSYTDFDGINPSTTNWSVKGTLEIDSTDAEIDTSEVLSWAVSFTDGTQTFSFDSLASNLYSFILDAEISGAMLVIERLVAQVRTISDEGALTYEAFFIENKDDGAYYLTTVNAGRYVPQVSLTDGFKGTARTETQPLAEIAPVPLPAAGWVMLASLGGLFAARRARIA